jgi:uncharacterized membrane-anchored protein YhcB (DUF1043 family)
MGPFRVDLARKAERYTRRRSPGKVQAIVRKGEVEEVKAHFDQRTAEVKSHFDRRTVEVKAHFDERTTDVKAHVDERAVETTRHFGVVAEGLRSEIRQVAEGVMLANQRRSSLHETSRPTTRLVAGG